MKQIIIAFSVLLCMSACGNSQSTPEQVTIPEAGKEQTAIATTETTPAGPKDPVCEMEKDATWTEYSASGKDTTWFCSANCKKAYEANPAKYAAH